MIKTAIIWREIALEINQRTGITVALDSVEPKNVEFLGVQKDIIVIFANFVKIKIVIISVMLAKRFLKAIKNKKKVYFKIS